MDTRAIAAFAAMGTCFNTAELADHKLWVIINLVMGVAFLVVMWRAIREAR